MTASDVPAERRLGLKKKSNEEKTTASYVSWLVYFMNSEVPERHFAPFGIGITGLRLQVLKGGRGPRPE
jgi:hypothetical protein